MELNRKVGQAVVLNIYDLAPDLNMWLYGAGLGVYHSGIEVSGTEYSFASGAGIFEGSPKDAPGATFRESILLGEFKGSAADIRGVAATMRDDYSGDKYNIMSKNCNCFANDFSLNLINKPIPNWVNRLGYYGSFCSCFFPPEMQGSAPVGDASGSSGGGGARSRNSRWFPGTMHSQGPVRRLAVAVAAGARGRRPRPRSRARHSGTWTVSAAWRGSQKAPARTDGRAAGGWRRMRIHFGV